MQKKYRATMSSRQLLACQYCGRSNFKSALGLKQHQERSNLCSEAMRDAKRKLAQQEEQARKRVQANSHLSDEESDEESGQIADMSAAPQPAHAAEEADSDNEIVMEQDDDSWGFGNDDDGSESDLIGYPTQALAQFKACVAHVRDHTLPFDKDEIAAIELLDTLKRKKATLDTYPAIWKWHVEHYPKIPGVEQPKFIPREKLIQKLAMRYNMPTKTVLHHGKEKQVPDLVKKKVIVLPSSGAKVDIIYHDARDQVVSLLTDPRFEDEDFLHFDDNPLAPPPENLSYVEDVNTGTAYTKTYKKLITNPQKQMLVPILLYIDGAVTGQFDKLEVEALKMSLGILKKRARDKDYGWRTLGYVPNYTGSDSRGKKILQESQHAAASLLPTAEEEGIVDQSDEDSDAASQGFRYIAEEDYELHNNKAQDYHKILATILESYQQLEANGMVWDYKYRGKLYKDVRLVFFIEFVPCDNDEADKLCGHYRSRGEHVASLCRFCTIRTGQADSHFMPKNVKLKTTAKIKRLVDCRQLEKLKDWSQQDIINAFHPLRFGLHNDLGVHGACPMEMLHQILLGLFKNVRDCFFVQIGLRSKLSPEINAIAKLLGKMFARQSDRDLPKTNFSKGIFEGKIMGKEFVGVMLLIAAILQTQKGRDVLKKVQKGHFKHHWLVQDWILLVETLLEWEAFLKLPKMELKHVKRLERKHQFVMYLIKKVCRRQQGMGLKFMKYHGILHIVFCILAFGVPSCMDTGPEESHHKVTKVAAKLTQRNITVFEVQTARRLVEFLLIDLAIAEIDGKCVFEYFDLDQERGAVDFGQAAEENLADGQTHYTGGTSIRVFRDEATGETGWHLGRSGKKTAHWEDQIVDFLVEMQEHMFGEGVLSLEVSTEHKRNGQIFRGHPDYRANGQWNDWAIFDWGDYGDLPGEIWCFVDFTREDDYWSAKFAGCELTNGVYAVVESAEHCPNVGPHGLQNDSDLFTPIIKTTKSLKNDGTIDKRCFYLADVEAIISPACVIPDVGSPNKCRYFVVTPREKWAGRFIEWLEAPHADDEEEMSDKDE